jgi:hypothetical protein
MAYKARPTFNQRCAPDYILNCYKNVWKKLLKKTFCRIKLSGGKLDRSVSWKKLRECREMGTFLIAPKAPDPLEYQNQNLL